MSKEDSEGPAPGARCAFFMPRKNRTCKFLPIPGQSYCGNHLNECTGHGEVFIPCPIDPSHSVAASKLQSHLGKCTKAKQIEALHAQPYFSSDANGGEENDPVLDDDMKAENEAERQNPFGPGRAKRRESYARRNGQEAFEDLIARVERVHQEVCHEPLRSILEPPECDKVMKPASDGSRPFSKKHASQYASILGNMAQFGLLNSQGSEESALTSIDLGAGKGWLSYMMRDCWGTAVKRILLVDNRGFKNKADKSLRDFNMSRLLIDLRDLSIGSGLMGSNERWLAMGKHCCGASTDYSLRCCVLSGMSNNMAGLAIAPCCHHRCGWRAYVGKKAMRKWGFSPEEFELISWMTGWALCGHSCETSGSDKDRQDGEEDREKLDENKEENEEGLGTGVGKRKRADGVEAQGGGDLTSENGPFIQLTRETKQRVGAMSKALIDAGRLEWIKEHGLVADVIIYTQESGENRLILAKPRSDS